MSHVSGGSFLHKMFGNMLICILPSEKSKIGVISCECALDNYFLFKYSSGQRILTYNSEAIQNV